MKRTIPTVSMSIVYQRVEKLNQRIARMNLDFPPLKVVELGTTISDYKVDIRGQEGIERQQIELTEFEIQGESPRYRGWEIAAVLQHTELNKNIIRRSPFFTVEIPEKYRTSPSTVCEHCNTSRPRGDTILVYNAETQAFKQIGKSCLADFLGHAISKVIPWVQDLEDSLEDEEIIRAGRCAPRFYEIIEILTQTAHYALQFGYVSKAQAEQTLIPSTRDRAIRNFFAKASDEGFERVTEEDKAEAQAAIDWFKTTYPQFEGLKNDFLSSCWVAMNRSKVTTREFGLVIAVFGMFWRDKNKRELPVSQFVGTVGDRMVFEEVEVLQNFPLQSMYGFQALNIFLTKDGNLLVWKTGAAFRPGSFMTFKGTIKEHSEYKGRKQTVVTRCKIMDSGEGQHA